MREFAREFYKSQSWLRCSRGFMQSKNYICERCGAPASICHHKKYLTPENINNPLIALNWNNLECLCQECHNIEHMQKHSKVYFDESGQIERVRENSEIREIEREKREYDRLEKRLELLRRSKTL